MPKATCSASDCDRPAHSRGMCTMHYSRWWYRRKKSLPLGATNDDLRRRKRMPPFCSEDGCDRPTMALNLCARHYQNEYTRRDRAANPEKWRNYHLSRYGITAADYDAMLAAQDGVCAICGATDSRALSVDHDHATGKVRGLLCQKCNVAIGHFDDDPVLIALALEYLR